MSPATADDRRSAPRRSTNVDGVLASDAGAATISIADVSEHGCRISLPDGLRDGAAVLLSFPGIAPFEAKIVWAEGGTAGVAFEYPVHPAVVDELAGTGPGRRRSRRLAPTLIPRGDRERLADLQLRVRLEQEQAPIMTGELRDLSVEGCRLLASAPLPNGARLRLTIGDQPPVEGVVRWSHDGAIGIEFSRALDLASVERIVAP